MTALTPIPPKEAVELYLDQRRSELAQKTIRSYRMDLNQFVKWCRSNDVDNLNELSGRHLNQYRLEMADGLAQTSLQIKLCRFRVFLKWATTIEAVDDSLPEKVIIPKVTDGARTEMPNVETIQSIIERLRKFDYASRRHVIFELLWHTGIRTGTVRSFDVEDYDSKKQYIATHHRPTEDTPLKNGVEGERYIALNEEMCLLLDDYLRMKRTSVEDEYGRSPLFTTDNGRIAKPTIRRTIYRLTQPCFYSGECPHGRDIASCEAAQYKNESGKCPSSYSGHPMRRAAITNFLKSDVPDTVVSDRFDVSRDVLDAHYDQRTEKEKVEQRRGYLDSI
ncbi:tyrosine-type recombinase/integrase [Haladaptatus sp. CMAA 1911]|uniref:tyrosine-type recombinase/integrase n=1 Tax=unclassified Haladaptatus TaxID=2622732 RepID=UPI003754E7BD